MNNVIGDKLASEWQHIRHPRFHGLAYDHPATQHDQTDTQESQMSRITDAKNAIDHASQQLAAMAANPLADAIAEAGVGAAFGPADVAVVMNLIQAIEHGPVGVVAQQAPQQATSAQQLQPQQTEPTLHI